jgi:hypothetical protein
MIDNKNKMKCEKCGQEMTKSGPYLHYKEEGESVYNGPEKNKAYWYCMNEKCENCYKSIEVIE